ncbi:hypothetical protein BST81_00605 [Leptolyngbya sp. 'hensonii']|uniref:FecR domain-containing protein n=1 Tax=Leptolyngbya sp. 'hensonii' TaxID=1922337 RepID=UPI0009502262|nr:FecR domain-containing protein [Leptolyngbya sp. 'hensonii']OLP20276.1 hypothetical protein BST81_00605 [Leptolyngbya sp. 'hensonii']
MFRHRVSGSLSNSDKIKLSALGLGITGVLLSATAIAQPVPLTRATVQSIRNQVSLIPRNQARRSARIADVMIPGDALATALASLAELRFNDGSLARIGEQAVFRFVPKTRTFHLSNGTVLVLIPPGRGTTRVRTPNATAGIKGSSFFIRTYVLNGGSTPSEQASEQDFEGVESKNFVTIMGAIGCNPGRPMEIATSDGSQKKEICGGEMAIVSGNTIQVVRYDVQEFLQSADLVKGLKLNQPPDATDLDIDMAQVRQEILETLQNLSPLDNNKPIYENLPALKLPTNQPVAASPGLLSPNFTVEVLEASTLLDITNNWGLGGSKFTLDQLTAANQFLLKPVKISVQIQSPPVTGPSPTVSTIKPIDIVPIVPSGGLNNPPPSGSPGSSGGVPVTPDPSPPKVSPSPAPVLPVNPSPSPIVPVNPSPAPVLPVDPSPSPILPVNPSPAPVLPVDPSPSPILPVNPSPAPVLPVDPSPSPILPVTPSPAPVLPVGPSPSPIIPVSPSPDPGTSIFPGGGATGGQFPGSGATGGQFPGANADVNPPTPPVVDLVQPAVSVDVQVPLGNNLNATITPPVVDVILPGTQSQTSNP